ncbi:MAG: metal ABC transporter permease [Saprospiraceae bacterium]
MTDLLQHLPNLGPCAPCRLLHGRGDVRHFGLFYCFEKHGAGSAMPYRMPFCQVVVAYVLGMGSALALSAGRLSRLLTAIVITWIQRNVKTKNDAAIGIVFTAMFSIGVIGISRISRIPATILI